MIHESAEILKADDLYDIQEQGRIEYRMTPGELGWLNFVSGRYCIADYIRENLEDDVVTLDTFELSKALEDDDAAPFAVCLDQSTALARVFFWLYTETEQ